MQRAHESLYYVATGGCIQCNKERARESQRIQRKALQRMQATNGMVDHTVTVHQQDAETVNMLADQLNAARGIAPPVSDSTPPDPDSPEGINAYYEKHGDSL